MLGGEYVVCYSDKLHYYVNFSGHGNGIVVGNYRRWIFDKVVRGTWRSKFYRIELYIDKRLDITSCWKYRICDPDDVHPEYHIDINPANHLKNKQNTLFIYPHWWGTPRCNISKRLAIGKDFEHGKIYIERNGNIRKIKS